MVIEKTISTVIGNRYISKSSLQEELFFRTQRELYKMHFDPLQFHWKVNVEQKELVFFKSDNAMCDCHIYLAILCVQKKNAEEKNAVQ